MTDAKHTDAPTEHKRDDASATSPGSQGDRERELVARIGELETQRSGLVAGLVWATGQLSKVLNTRSDVHATATRDPHASHRDDGRGRSLDDDLGAFREPGPDDPYPLSASEDRPAYHRWLQERRQPVVVGGGGDPVPKRAVTRDPRSAEPLISVLMPVYKTPIWALERSVGSVLRQSFANWELCICDDASDDQEICKLLTDLARKDSRIRVTALVENSGISVATNRALDLSRGRYITFLDHDDELTPDALGTVASTIATSPSADFIYSDEDKIDASGERFDPLFKPDWSPDLLLSFAYTCHLAVISRALVERAGALRQEFDGSQDYDLALRATELAGTIVHVSEVLYHWRTLPGSAATDTTASVAKPWAYDAGTRAIADALKRRNEPGEVVPDARFPGRYHVRREVPGRPRVSIVIPFRDEPKMLATCIATMRRDPGYDNFEFVLVDNNSELPETMALLDRLVDDDDVIVARYHKPFNWSAVNNFGAAAATGEVLLFSNNDIEAKSPGWLHAMLGHAMRPEVGAVGAKLLYPDGTIQHAGVVIGLGGIAGHILRGLPGDRPGYNSTSIATRDCSVVTGACLMTRRAIFDQVGGFSEELAVAFNDVDFCLKVRRQGLLVVYTPLAELIHHESRSRGHTDDLVEHGVFVARWADEIIAGDPYMNNNLSHWRYWCPLATPQEDYRWKTYLERSILTQSSLSSV